MQSNLKVLYISAEIAPFAKSSPLAELAGELPKALKELGVDIRLFVPKYGVINDRRYTLREVIRLKNIEVSLHSKNVIANVKSAFLPGSKVQVYFVGNKDYFDRDGLYIDPDTQQPWQDNAERFIFFNKAIFAILQKLHWQPDIIHCNDWQTALIPFFLKNIFNNDPFFEKAQTLLSIHDFSNQGAFEKSVANFIGEPGTIFFPNAPLEHQGKVNFLKAGIVSADFINVMSKSYAREIRTSEEASFGLLRQLKKRSKTIAGIINGIDYSIWDPANDEKIPYRFTRKNPSEKIENKRHLVESQQLKFDEHKAVIGSFFPALDQQQLDFIARVVEKSKPHKLQYIFSIPDDEKYRSFFRSLKKKYPDKIAFGTAFDDQFVRLMAAGCDMFLIPCRIEPCDSFHLYGLKYGTIPIVHGTGGLLDTVKDFNPETGKGYGFVFHEYSPEAALEKIEQAIKFFGDRAIWRKIVDSAMRVNFSWQTTAENYLKLYDKIMSL